MDITRRQFGEGLVGFLLSRYLLADESGSGIIKPSLEEIASLIKKDPNEILKPAIERGEIKKFEYNRQTQPEDFYEFLRKNFTERTLVLYLEIDDNTHKKNRWGNESTGDFRLGSGAAIVFSFVNKNLKGINKVGLLYLELKDFYGEENWGRLRKLFGESRMEFPSAAEFIKNSTGDYKFIEELVGCGVKSPEKIWKNIENYVGHYSNK